MKKTTFRLPDQSGQAVTEYVIMLLMVLFLVFALTALAEAVCDQGERMVNIAAYNVP